MTRILHILHHSPSLFHDEALDALLKRSAWHLQVAHFQRKYLANCEVECWAPERRADRIVTTQQGDITSVFFPSYCFGYQKEVSPKLFGHLSQRSRDFDWVFLHGSVSYFSSLLLRRFGRRARFVVQNHGERTTLTRTLRPGARKPLDYWLRVRLEQSALSNAHKLLCLNSENLDDYRRNGVPEEKLALCTMGVDLSLFTRSPTRKRP
ncbi:MAG: glycosyltransferase [Polyangiaceae bacterium]